MAECLFAAPGPKGERGPSGPQGPTGPGASLTVRTIYSQYVTGSRTNPYTLATLSTTPLFILFDLWSYDFGYYLTIMPQNQEFITFSREDNGTHSFLIYLRSNTIQVESNGTIREHHYIVL